MNEYIKSHAEWVMQYNSFDDNSRLGWICYARAWSKTVYVHAKYFDWELS